MLESHITPDCERWPSYTLVAPNQFLSPLSFNRETYTRVLWHRTDKTHAENQHCLLGYKHLSSAAPRKQLGNWLGFKEKAKCWHQALGETRASTDCYFTPNEFFVWSKTSNLALLHANWLDIDLIEPLKYSGREATRQAVALTVKQVLSEVKSLLLAAKIPPPSGYVSSGSGGVHLYWIYDPVNAYPQTVKVWRMIADSLCKPLKKCQKRIWKVDCNASKRPAGLLRLPGSLHSRTSCQVLGYTGGGLYQFDQLAVSLGIQATKIRPIDKMCTKLRRPPRPLSSLTQYISPRKHTIGQWWFKIYSHICSHFRRQGFCSCWQTKLFLVYLLCRTT